MNKRNITYIIIIMTGALLGLISLQFYWLNASLSVNEEKFKHEVHEALNEVVHKLEMHDAVKVTQKTIGDGVAIVHDSAFVDVDSAGNVRWLEEKLVRSTQLIGTDRLAADGFAYSVEEEMLIKRTGMARKRSVSELDLADITLVKDEPILNLGEQKNTSMFKPSFNSEKLSKKEKKEADKQSIPVMKYSEMVSSIINELVSVSKGRNVQDLISQQILDSLILMELSDRGIDLEYKYGIRDMDKPNADFIYTNSPEYRTELLDVGFNVRLFPTSPYGTRNMLYLYFPDHQQFVFGKMWLVLVSSAVFLALVIFSFSYAIRTIFRQKKLSEITNDFISNMTHELKTPIATVSLATEALLDPDIRAMSSQLERYLNVIKEENARLGKQVEKVLNIARLDKGDFKLNVSAVDVHEIIESVCKNHAIQVESRGGILKKYLGAQQTRIEADRLHLTNIIHNLLDNANKYSPEAPHLSVTTDSDAKGVTVMIADRGVGIPKDMVNKIFDKFYRVPTGNVHDVKGFGLGLSYVKKMVDAHHGNISVKSELGKGSIFTIFLPYKHEQS